MRKTLVVIVAIIMLFGASGCGSGPAVHEELSPVDVANASNIAAAINEHNALYLKSILNNKTTMEDAKKLIGKCQWPEGLSDEDERAAWKRIVIKDGVASLTQEAQEVLHGVARDAYSIALAINCYNALYPSDPLGMLDDDITLEDAKVYVKNRDEACGVAFWPAGLSDDEERAAWELIVYEDCVADLSPEAQKALQEGSRDESDEDIIANASNIATGISVYNAFHPDDMLPDDVTLAEDKEALVKDGLWPTFLSDAEAEAAWELIEIKDGVATVKSED